MKVVIRYRGRDPHGATAAPAHPNGRRDATHCRSPPGASFWLAAPQLLNTTLVRVTPFGAQPSNLTIVTQETPQFQQVIALPLQLRLHQSVFVDSILKIRVRGKQAVAILNEHVNRIPAKGCDLNQSCRVSFFEKLQNETSAGSSVER